MALFVQVVAFHGARTKKDTEVLNNILSTLQNNGAKIVRVSHSGAGGSMFLGASSSLFVYLITYESDQPLRIKI